MVSSYLTNRTTEVEECVLIIDLLNQVFPKSDCTKLLTWQTTEQEQKLLFCIQQKTNELELAAIFAKPMSEIKQVIQNSLRFQHHHEYEIEMVSSCASQKTCEFFILKHESIYNN